MAVHIFLKFVDPSAHPPRAPCSSPTDAPAWPKPDLSPPADFDGDGILAFVALAGSSCLRGDGAAGACREGTSGGVSCLTGDGTAGACREGTSGRVSCPGEEAVYQAGRGGTSGGGATQAPSGATSPCALLILLLLGSNLASLPRQILTAMASLRSSCLQNHPPLARLTPQLLAASR